MKVLSTSEFKEMTQKNGAEIINVLPPEEFEKEHIPGSVNIPVARPDFEHKVGDRVRNRDAPIVVYCSSEECTASPKAARRLEQAGFTKVYHFEAGMEGWKNAGFSVEAGA